MGTWYCACNGDFSLTNVFETLMRHDSGAGERGIWGDKSPSYIGHIPLLMRLYPKAKIVHIVRDARDYILSMEKSFGKISAARCPSLVRLGGPQPLPPSSVSQNQCTACAMRTCWILPETQLKLLCQFLSVPFTDSMLSLSHSPENLGDTTGARHIVGGNHGKYRQQMNLEEQAEVEAFCPVELKEAGYEVSYVGPVRRLSKAELRRLQAKDAVQLIRRDAKDRGWRTAIHGRLLHYFFA